MTKPPQAKAHHVTDCWPVVGLVRDAQQREETFRILAAQIIDTSASFDAFDYLHGGYEVAPPEWRWYRINPCTPNCGDHAWHYDDGKQGRQGSFLGALITIRRKP